MDEASHLVSISKVAPITLGIAILVQCALSAWCLYTSNIPTWSSHPLTTLSAATQQDGLVHRRGRAMMSAHMRSSPARPTTPSAQQRSPFAVLRRILYVLIAVTVVLITFAIWAAVMIKLGESDYANRSWPLFQLAPLIRLEDRLIQHIEYDLDCVSQILHCT